MKSPFQLPFAHRFVIENVLGFFGFARPQQGLMTCGEEAARQIRRRIGLIPCDVIQNFIAQELQRVTAGVDGVIGAANPNRAFGFQHALAGGNPVHVKLEIFFQPLAFVPLAFVDAGALSGMHREAVIGKHVGRIGEHHVEMIFGELRQVARDNRLAADRIRFH